MTSRTVPSLVLRASLLSLTVALGSGIAQNAHAQFQTTDPYDPYGQYYKPFTYPIQQNSSQSLPNQARLSEIGSGLRGSGAFDSIDGAGEDLFGRGVGRLEGIGGPNRYYEPNAGDTFYADQLKREQKYFEAMNQKDRRKRAALLREYREMTNKAARGASTKSAKKTKAKKGDVKTAEATADEPNLLRSDDETATDDATPRTRLRRPSELLVPRGGASRGGLLRNPDSVKPSAPASPTQVLNRSLDSDPKPAAGSLDTPGSDPADTP